MSTRILVVDDELDTLNLLRTILEISGYTPITTLNSVDALALAEVENPDVVLLDIMMPKPDGFTLCKMMRQNDSTKDLPIIFVTAYESLDIEERRKDAGADMVIHKPINMDVLIKAVQDVPTLRQRARIAAQMKPSNGTEATIKTIMTPATTTNPATPPAVSSKTQESDMAKPDSDKKQ